MCPCCLQLSWSFLLFLSVLFLNATQHGQISLYSSCLDFFVKPHNHDSGLLDFNHKWRYFEFMKCRATSSIASADSKNQWCGQNPAGLFFSESEMLSKTGSLPLARISWDLLFVWQAIKRQPTKAFFWSL